MKVGTAIPKGQRCPHHNSIMEFAVTTMDEPTWTCDECECDYTVPDLIREGDIKPSFVTL